MTYAADVDGDCIVLRCAWLLNPGVPPRQNVRISVVEGRVSEIVDVPADEHSLIKPIAVVPQFVNAHTHLEFSQLTEPVPPPTPFPDWIRSVIAYRTQNSADSFVAKSVRSGLTESARSGVGLIGEITTSDEGRTALQYAKNRSVSFREFIGFSRQSLDTQASLAAETVRLENSDAVTIGLSPHAPYSVHSELFEAVIGLGVQAEMPVAMHLAETADEIEFLNNRSGRFVEFLQQLNLWEESSLGGNRSVLPYLQKLGQCRHSLAIHGNYLTDEEIRFLGRNPHVAVVYCPRTHRWFGHSPHPYPKLIAAGATVILGTDSRASNPDLDVWRELQYIAGLQASSAIWDLLPMITTSAATALGKNPFGFRIAVGKRMRAVAVSCGCNSHSKLNAELISERCRPVEVF